MPFEKITPEKLSCAVVRQIELLILRGILQPGERLPSERVLAERLGVSRPSLREAVASESGARPDASASRQARARASSCRCTSTDRFAASSQAAADHAPRQRSTSLADSLQAVNP